MRNLKRNKDSGCGVERGCRSSFQNQYEEILPRGQNKQTDHEVQENRTRTVQSSVNESRNSGRKPGIEYRDGLHRTIEGSRFCSGSVDNEYESTFRSDRGSRHQEFRTRTLVVVVVMYPYTIFTFKIRGEVWMTQSLRPPPRVVKHKIVREVPQHYV